VLNGEMDSKDANAIIYACNTTLSTIRVDEQEKRLDELEKLIKEYQMTGFMKRIEDLKAELKPL
jgi:hypothetical protein